MSSCGWQWDGKAVRNCPVFRVEEGRATGLWKQKESTSVQMKGRGQGDRVEAGSRSNHLEIGLRTQARAQGCAGKRTGLLFAWFSLFRSVEHIFICWRLIYNSGNLLLREQVFSGMKHLGKQNVEVEKSVSQHSQAETCVEARTGGRGGWSE